MNMMTHGGVTAPSNITEIAENTSATCLSTRIRQLNRIITRVYDDAMRPLGITASQFTLLTQLAQQDGITAVEIGHTLDIEKSTLSRNLKRLLKYSGTGPVSRTSALLIFMRCALWRMLFPAEHSMARFAPACAT